VTVNGRGPSQRARGASPGGWLNVAAIATWLVSGLAPLAEIADPGVPWWAGILFVSAYLLFGVALLLLLYVPERTFPGGRMIPILLLVVESAAGLVVMGVSAYHLGGTGATSATVVIVAAQLPYVVSPRWVWVCVGMQTLAMSLLFSGGPLADVISVAIAVGGFQAFAAASSMLALREAAAREKLAVAHAELQQAQARLADSSRAEERLRISRDLHDTLGHHLTALSLQLEVASRLTEGKAAAHVQQAHAITRLLLSDVRDVVSTLREARPIDLGLEIRALAETPSALAIHVDIPPGLDVPDADRAEAVLRCVQEIITNATRHAQARNLWIRIESRAGGIALHARDDGQGVRQLSLGHGLTGMRERFAALAGSVEFEAHPESGFEVRGFMPTPHAVPRAS
jgi:signal transduction histidine kinase